MLEVNDNNVLMTPDTLEQLRYIEKVNFKRESKVDNPSKYRMVLNIILEEIRRHQEKNQPLLKGYLDSNILYDKECLEEARVHVDKRLVDVRLYLLELFGVDTLREVNDLVKEATNFLETKGPDNKKALRDIEAKLKQVNEQLTSLEKDQLRNRETFNSISGIEIETKKKR